MRAWPIISARTRTVAPAAAGHWRRREGCPLRPRRPHSTLVANTGRPRSTLVANTGHSNPPPLPRHHRRPRAALRGEERLRAGGRLPHRAGTVCFHIIRNLETMHD